MWQCGEWRRALVQKTGAIFTRMAIEFETKSNEEIPAELQSQFVGRDGGFVLDARSWLLVSVIGGREFKATA